MNSVFRQRAPFSTIAIFGLLLISGIPASWADMSSLKLPNGFSIEQLNFKVANARQMALTGQGALIVGTLRQGKVYAVPNALTASEPQVIELLQNLDMPSGVTVHKGDLYVAALDSVFKVAAIDQQINSSAPAANTRQALQIITDTLPDKSHHGWKYIKFGPDGQLYVPVGAPCNICLSDDARFASLLRMDPASGTTSIWAHGIRNTVGFAWHPQSQAMWFSDNGRDMLGDDVPPEEINRIDKAGQHFGYPFVHATDIDDPEFGDHDHRNQWQFTPPVIEIQAHSAALGMTFYNHHQFPRAYHHALFVAEHGSWNRSRKVGYQVSVAVPDEQGNFSYQPFVTGWLDQEKDWGRPNDVIVTPDGSLLISDDKRGVIYRVRYSNPH